MLQLIFYYDPIPWLSLWDTPEGILLITGISVLILIIFTIVSIVSGVKAKNIYLSGSKQGNLEKLTFTAGYPNVIRPDNWYSLFFYLYLPKFSRKVKTMLENNWKQPSSQPAVSATESFELIEKGTILTIIPNVKGIIFNPNKQEIAWYEDIQEIIFRLKAGSGVLDHSTIGSMDVYKEGLLIGQIPISITISHAINPVEFAKELGKIFEQLFISYSHKDALIVDQCILAYNALGIKVNLDKTSLRSGDKWKERLLHLIDRSDIFQLYWSKASKDSLNVTQEWQHALSLVSQKGERFIRPCYWEIPMPDPPKELESFHFVELDIDKIKTF
ncbi:MAG: toll/interleukin-1 receptor domain-containing protein [Candidatus Hermodarchaeota archaeon]